MNSTGIRYNEYELIYMIREQNEDALKLMIKQYTPLIGKIASNYVARGTEFEDYFQEGLMAFVKSIYSYNEFIESSFYSYTMTCIKNGVITCYRNLHRSTKFEYMMIDDLNFAEKIAEQSAHQYLDSFHTTLNHKILLEQLMNDENILSDFEKQCLKQCLMGHNYNEISLILCVPPKKVDNAIHRCKTKIKNLVKLETSTSQYH